MKILILDDSEERLKLFRKKFIGHSVTTVKTAFDAIRCLDIQGPFDCVFLDHDLGGKTMVPSGEGTGYEVAFWLSFNINKAPKQIIIHSFNPDGAKNMLTILPGSVYSPGAWI